jgi:hypothetical protein
LTVLLDALIQIRVRGLSITLLVIRLLLEQIWHQPRRHIFSLDFRLRPVSTACTSSTSSAGFADSARRARWFIRGHTRAVAILGTQE